MNPVYLSLSAMLFIAQLVLPRKFAFLPLVFAACHMGSEEIIPQLTVARTLIIAGLARAMISGFFVGPGRCKLDQVFYVFSFFLVLSTVGHTADEYFPSPFQARCGLVLNAFGAYLYARSYIPDIAAFLRYVRWLPLMLLPLAALMVVQKATERSLYSVIGVGSDSAAIREDKIRAQGSFKHPILAGCSGATALPLAVLLWYQRKRALSALAIAVTMTITLASASSGPLAAVAVSFASILLWRWRHHLKSFLWLALCLGIFYTVVKGRGPWYIMSSLDLVGGSTGWHRAKLMDQGWTYLSDWWLFGTDYTRHWMSSGTRWNPNMVDLTNYYLHLGVTAGLSAMLSLIAMIVVGFRLLWLRMKELRQASSIDERVLWSAGASLAAHALAFVAISYFDQMYIFFYVLLGTIPGLVSSPMRDALGVDAVNVTRSTASCVRDRREVVKG